MVAGDFNEIMNDSENIGGLHATQMENTESSQCVCNPELTEFPYFGSLYTWWNGRIEEDSIFKRLIGCWAMNCFGRNAITVFSNIW